MRYALSIIFLLTSYGMASQVPDKVGIQTIERFDKGYVTAYPEHKIDSGASPDCRNVYFDGASVGTRAGWEIVDTSDVLQNVNLVDKYNSSDGKEYFIVSDSSIVLQGDLSGNWTLIKDKLNPTFSLRYVQHRGKGYFSNGNDPVFTWDGSSCVVLDGGNYGLVARPNVPRGKYIATYQERLFVYSTTDNASALHFQLLVDTTNANAINADEETAWPWTNTQYVGKGDGENGTFLGVLGGILRIGKESSIYTLYGRGGTSYDASRTKSLVGYTSQESVTEHLNNLYGLTQDGFYSFDGNQTEELSDGIYPDIENIKRGALSALSEEWDTADDFSRGLFTGSSFTASGLVDLKTDIPVQPWPYLQGVSGASGDHILTVSPGALEFSTSTNWLNMENETGVPFNNLETFAVYIDNAKTRCQQTIGGSEALKFRFSFWDGASNIVHTAWANYNDLTITMNFSGQKFFCTTGQLKDGDIKYRIEVDTTAVGANWGTHIYYGGGLGVGYRSLLKNTTGYYTSDITTITTITNWDKFDAVKTDDGGSVQFTYRTATSAVNITTYPYLPISPGGIIGSSVTDNYIQWSATITAAPESSSPNIDKVTISYLQGSGAQTRAFSVSWGNDWWVGVATESSGNYPMIYVYSGGTWSPYDSIPVRCFLKDGDTLYGGHATQGSVVRLDYGTNDNGNAIDAYYDTPAMLLGDGLVYKDLYEYLIDTERNTGHTLTVMSSIDGADFMTNTLDLDGSGRGVGVIRKPNAGGGTYCRSLKLRFRNNTLDHSMNIYGLSILYRPTKKR